MGACFCGFIANGVVIRIKNEICFNYICNLKNKTEDDVRNIINDALIRFAVVVMVWEMIVVCLYSLSYGCELLARVDLFGLTTFLSIPVVLLIWHGLDL